MKKGLLIGSACVVIMALIAGAWYLNRPQTSPEQEKMEWCYGVYHETKAFQETREHDNWLHSSETYRRLEDSDFFKAGKSEAKHVNAEERTKCYEMVYPMLAELQREKDNLNESVPYCFGYLQEAREEDYIPVFCEQKCAMLSQEDCIYWCKYDLDQNLRPDPRERGEKDAAVHVNPAQFVKCIQKLKDIL